VKLVFCQLVIPYYLDKQIRSSHPTNNCPQYNRCAIKVATKRTLYFVIRIGILERDVDNFELFTC
jgi:hypothetical protein